MEGKSKHHAIKALKVMKIVLVDGDSTDFNSEDNQIFHLEIHAFSNICGPFVG